ncbi:MAG: SCO family protein [Blastocatellia bacterium]|nr:SCO family protein [Blastocatellia bacterium]
MKYNLRAVVLALVWWLAVTVSVGAQNPPAQSFEGGNPTSGITRDAQAVLEKVGIDQHLNEQIPLDTEFFDQNGYRVQLRQYFGKKPVILAPVYYACPSLCNQVLNGVMGSAIQMPESAGKDFIVLVVSFDPREKPELAFGKRQAYLNRYSRPGSDSGWQFLTGTEASIQKLMGSVGFRYAWDDRTKQFAHSSAIMVLTPEGRLSQYLYGVEYPPKMVSSALSVAGSNHIGKPADQILLYCFHYDPATGKYSVIAVRVVQLCGLLTLVGLGTLLFFLFRSERRDRKLTEQRG